MASPKRTVLITGCSDGGLGAGLAIAFHNAGLHVYATARTPSKMAGLAALGIETLQLDVLSDTSIAACVSKLSSLDILVNNAGNSYTMPVSDISLPAAKELFDLNVWSYIAVTQAFLPLLLASKAAQGGMIVNQTSLVSVMAVPFQATYNASKAAMAMFSNNMRLELAPFGIRVVELKTALVKSNLIVNSRGGAPSEKRLPEGSIYEPAREAVEKMMRAEAFEDAGTETQVWADAVVGDLLRKTPPSIVWRGVQATAGWLGTWLPFGWTDGMMKKMAGLDFVEQKVRKA